MLGADGVMLADDRYKAELLNSYLASIFSIFKNDLQRGKDSINTVKGNCSPRCEAPQKMNTWPL